MNFFKKKNLIHDERKKILLKLGPEENFFKRMKGSYKNSTLNITLTMKFWMLSPSDQGNGKDNCSHLFYSTLYWRF